MRVVNLSEGWALPWAVPEAVGGMAHRQREPPRALQQPGNERRAVTCTASARCKFIRGMDSAWEAARCKTSARCKFIRGMGPAWGATRRTASARCKFIRGMRPGGCCRGDGCLRKVA